MLEIATNYAVYGYFVLKNSLLIEQQSSSGPVCNGFIQSDKQFVFHPRMLF